MFGLDFIGVGNGLIDILLLLVILVALVVIHEFGHFIVARRAGVTVHEFGIGFPPRAKVLGTDSKGTTYTLNWLPIGGFVKLEGEDGDSDDPNSFTRQRLPTRLTILLAGVVMNFLLAFLIFTLIAAFADPVANARVGFVQPGSPAAVAGLQGGVQTGTDADGNAIYDESGDLIIAINGETFPVFDWTGAGTAGIPHSAYLRERAGQPVTITVRHLDGTVEDKIVTLRTAAEAAEQGALGVRFVALPTEDTQNGILDAIAIGFRRTVDAATLILRGLGDLIANITNPPVSGPVGIVGAIGQVRSELPPVFLLWFIGLLSANLAVVNALPFPPLDGGRVAVALIQKVTGGRISVAAERLAYLTGFILLMALLVWVTYFDIQRLG
ncbi:MAG TPA: M50 family metallopeptidase [Candidatus Limnocylindrales bacterium]|nr:M50 family metallopeptidase [Candidatus Limnocylindrales bacterium]